MSYEQRAFFAHSSQLIAHNQNQYAPQHPFHHRPYIASGIRFYSIQRNEE